MNCCVRKEAHSLNGGSCDQSEEACTYVVTGGSTKAKMKEEKSEADRLIVSNVKLQSALLSSQVFINSWQTKVASFSKRNLLIHQKKECDTKNDN